MMGSTADKCQGAEETTFPDGMTLTSVVIFFRHGARTPLTMIRAIDDSYCDPTRDEHFPPELAIPIQVVGLDGITTDPPPKMERSRLLPDGLIAGMLTEKGREESVEYGRSLKVRYMTRLGMKVNRFTPHESYLRAKNRQRTVDTLRCVLVGMYGRDGFHGDGHHGNHPVAAIRVAKVDDDILDWPRGVENSEIEPRLRGEVLRCLQLGASSGGSSPHAWGGGGGPRMFLFACSDTTISPMLDALGYLNHSRPPYLADLVFELYTDQRSNHWVKVVYRGRTIVPLRLFSIGAETCTSDVVRQTPGQFVTRIHYIP